MDGNRRWAKKHGWLPWDGHREGILAAQRVMEFCLVQRIAYLSLYTFSLENFARPEKEKQFLFTVLFKEIKKKLVPYLKEKDIRIAFIGDDSYFPENVRDYCLSIEEETQSGSSLTVNLLFCYGGRQEIVHGVNKIIQKINAGHVAIEAVDEKEFEKNLWMAGIPAPDLIVRTGGVQRLSNFLLFHAAYSELFFLDCLWPEINGAHLGSVIKSFYQRQRNFGQ